MGNESGMHDISRLYEALGIDPISYVSFGKQSGRPSGSAAPRPLGRTAGERTAVALGSALPGVAEPGIAELPRRTERAAVLSNAETGARPPMQVVLASPSGGSGKTTLAAALGNALRERKHSVLLADYSLYNTIQTLFALPGNAIRRVSFGMGSRTSAPLPILSRYQQGHPIPDFDSWLDSLSARTEVTLLDGLTDAVLQGRSHMERGARVLVPVLPEAVSAMSALTLDNALSASRPSRLMYVLNRFDPEQASHREVRVWLRENLGTQLLPFEVPDDPILRELATGAVVLKDLAPYLPIRMALESLVDLLERCGEHQNQEVAR